VQADQVGQHGRIAGRDVAEGTAVHQRRGVLQGLQQVRLDRLLQRHGHGPGGLELFSGHRLTVRRVTHHDPTEPRPQVIQVRLQRQGRHDLGGRGDVEPRLAAHPVRRAPQAKDDVAQRSVVDVEHPAPGDVVEVQPELVALVQVIVDHRRELVVCRGDGVHVAGEVQIELLHRHHLRMTPTGGPALDAQRRPHRRLPDRDHRGPADPRQPLTQPDRGRRLPLAQRRRRDRGDDDVLRPWPIRQLPDGVQADLHHVAAVGFEQVAAQPQLVGDVLDRLEAGGPRDLQIGGRHGGRPCEIFRVLRSGECAYGAPASSATAASTSGCRPSQVSARTRVRSGS
jgi:hypothetical protein